VALVQHARRMHRFVICGLPASTIFSTFSHKRHDFRKKPCWTRNVCFDFLYKFVWRHFHSKTNSARYDKKKCILVIISSTRYACPILMKLDFFRHNFLKIFKYQISWKSFQWKYSCCVRTDGWTDRHDDANSRLSQQYRVLNLRLTEYRYFKGLIP
jgi:hypothetical protein